MVCHFIIYAKSKSDYEHICAKFDKGLNINFVQLLTDNTRLSTNSKQQ